MGTTTINYKGKEYQSREIMYGDQYFMVSTESLDAALVTKGEYNDAEARYIDETILYYVSDEQINLPIDELEALVVNELAD